MKTTMKSVLSKLIAGISAGVILSSAHAEPVPVKMCAFMFMGEGGPEHQALMDYQAAALNWGAKIELKSYVHDKIVVEELKSGACDMANMPSLQARHFNKFTGTLDAPAAMPTYDHLRTVMQTLAKPSAAKYMRNGDYEIIGIQPAGAVFIFTNDNTLKSISDLAGKRMAVLDTMPEMRQLVVDLGMTPVSSTITNIFQKFNNNAIDITGGPAIVYEMMELDKGLRPNGGILENPVMQGNMQFVARWSKLPEGFAQKSREFFVQNFDQTLKTVREAEEKIPKDLWIPLDAQGVEEYNTQTRQIRLSFREQNVYDAKMLTLLRKIRCKKEPTRAECTDPNAE